MRLLFFTDNLGHGGAERVTANLANHWSRRGWEVIIVTHEAPTKDFYKVDSSVKRISLGLPTGAGRFPSTLWRNLRRIIALRRTLKLVKPDVAVGVMNIGAVLLAFASVGLPVQTIGAEHTYPPRSGQGAVRSWLRRHGYSLLSAVTALTREGAAWLEANTRVRKKVYVIPNPAIWPLPRQEPVVDPSLYCKPGRRIILAVGRLEEPKGFDVLIRIFATLAPNFAQWDLVIVGEGSERSALESIVRAAALDGRVFFPGRVGNPSEWYDHAEVFALSSRHEGFPNTLTEALAAGVPAVSFDCDTGPRDLIRDGVDGLLVRPQDEQGFAAALARLMTDDTFRRQCAERAVEVRSRYSMERIAALWEKLFEDVMLEA